MVRSIWKRTLVTSVAWAGLAWAQPPLNPPQPARPAPSAESTERLVTVQESGKPAQKCRVIRTWKTAEGASAYQVQATDTGEIMTMVESGPVTTVPGSREGTRKQAMATRIFHWGRDKTPPAGTPMPPGETTPTITRAVDTPKPIALPSPRAAELRTLAPVSTKTDATTNAGPITGASATSSGSAAVAKKSVEPARPTDWRQSWGKADDHASMSVAKIPQPLSPEKLVAAKPPLHTEAKSSDPLEIPEQYARVPVPEKPILPKIDSGRVPNENTPHESPAVFPQSDELPASSLVVEQAMPTDKGQGVPLGARSVMAAYGGDPDAVRYIPVPIVTVPDVQRPPIPPMPPVPQPMQPAGQNGSAGNAFVPAPASKPSGPVPTSDQRSVNAFTPAPPPGAMAQSANAFNRGNPMSAGVGTAGISANSPNPMMPQPLPPACTIMAEATAKEMTPQTIQQMMGILRDALYPSQRELAAESLAKVDWHTHPHVVQALLTAARQDPAATVRAGCVRCLAQMNVNTVVVVEVVQALRMDSDPRVRSEAEQAMIVVAPSSAFSKPAVLPASTRNGP